MADVFTDFYEQLFDTRRCAAKGKDPPREMFCKHSEGIEEVSGAEVEECLRKIAKNKAGDSSGIVVEML